MTPRLPYGSNCAANWGLLYDTFGKERITIYGLDGDADGGSRATARPLFGFDFDGRPTYDVPGFVIAARPGPAAAVRRGGRASPCGPHLGVMGVAPAEPGRRSSIPPGVFGGNVDNWRFGPGADRLLPGVRGGRPVLRR